MIIKDYYTSISELREKTSKVIDDLNILWTKIILSQNKPVWVFLSIEHYNNLKKTSFLREKANDEDIKAYKKSSHWKDAVEAFNFLKTLK